MASYWRALCLAGIFSLVAGVYGYVQPSPPPGVYYTLPPYVPAAIAAVLTFCGMTTLQAVWYLLRRQKGTAGRLLITAAVLPALYLVFAVAVAVFAMVSDDPTAQLGYAQLYLGMLALYLLIPVVWIGGGIWLILLDCRQRLAVASSVPEMGSSESGKWPPLPGPT